MRYNFNREWRRIRISWSFLSDCFLLQTMAVNICKLLRSVNNLVHFCYNVICYIYEVLPSSELVWHFVLQPVMYCCNFTLYLCVLLLPSDVWSIIIQSQCVKSGDISRAARYCSTCRITFIHVLVTQFLKGAVKYELPYKGALLVLFGSCGRLQIKWLALSDVFLFLVTIMLQFLVHIVTILKSKWLKEFGGGYRTEFDWNQSGKFWGLSDADGWM